MHQMHYCSFCLSGGKFLPRMPANRAQKSLATGEGISNVNVTRESYGNREEGNKKWKERAEGSPLMGEEAEKQKRISVSFIYISVFPKHFSLVTLDVLHKEYN